MENLRYEETPQDVKDLFEKVKTFNFQNLDGAKVIYVFYNKKKVTSGRIVVAYVKKLNDELKFFAMSDNGITYDYVVFIDKQVWGVLSEEDKKRIAFHEFCHCDVDGEKKNPYGIKDHEIQGFYDEVEYNVDDPRWSERIGDIAASIHDPENEG